MSQAAPASPTFPFPVDAPEREYRAEEAERAAQAIVAMVDYSRTLSRTHPAQGQFVVTGMQQGRRASVKRIGFCVQIRVGRGQFGSDMVFLRHADGGLTVHENQCFTAMSPEQEALARSVFTDLPEEEDFSRGYKCTEGIHEVGYVVENSVSRGAPDTAVVLVRVTEADGSVTSTAFL